MGCGQFLGGCGLGLEETKIFFVRDFKLSLQIALKPGAPAVLFVQHRIEGLAGFDKGLLCGHLRLAGANCAGYILALAPWVHEIRHEAPHDGKQVTKLLRCHRVTVRQVQILRRSLVVHITACLKCFAAQRHSQIASTALSSNLADFSFGDTR